MRTNGSRCGSLNPFVLSQIVASYEVWYEHADRLEKALLSRLLNRFARARTILEVACGRGHFTRWFSEQGLQAVGLDLSSPMLVEAVRLGGPPCLRGDAMALPFPRKAFDLVILITTLEFLPDPAQALAEALRTARHRLILGVLNRQSLLGRQLRNEGGSVWSAARLYTPGELTQLVQRVAVGKRTGIIWRTTLWPVWPRELSLPGVGSSVWP